MSYLSDISLRRGIALLLIIVAVLTGGVALAIKWTTDYLVNEDAGANARDWAHFLVANVTDLKQIAAGELPSAESMTFFEGTRKSNQVFRYVIFNREGYSQFVADREKIASVDLSEFSPEAAEAVHRRTTIVTTAEGTGSGLPDFFAQANVPVIVDGTPIGVVAAYVDETAQRARFRRSLFVAGVSLCALTILSFGIPAIAWYRRTREKQRSDRRIRYLAHHDPLTGLVNRGRLVERLESMLALLPSLETKLAVHFIDLDHFKEVNDSIGHDGGDFLLKTTAQRLTATVRADDLVARFGGDEFVIIQSHVGNKQQVEEFARRMIATVAAPMQYQQHEIAATVTVGVALAPDDGASTERLLKSADLALYAGKAAGRNCVKFFSPDMDDALQARLRLEKIIRDAVTNNRFELYYQPIYEMSTKRLTGYEALLRLPSPEGVLIPPETFIPAAEEMRLIDKIGAWVLHEACRTAATWPDNMRVSVNLAPSQFESGTIVNVVSSALKQSGLAAHRLEIEITESLLLGDTENNMAQLRALKELGVSIAMDDFGTGYSSLSYLWRFPFDKIKIDQGFMRDFEKSGHNVETVIKTIIALGRELHMCVTVEGVETANQATFLRDADVDQVQGFYFGHPIPASDVGASMLADFRDEQTAAREKKDKIVLAG